LTIPAIEVVFSAALPERPFTITLLGVRFKAEQVEQTKKDGVSLWWNDDVVTIYTDRAGTDVRQFARKARKCPK
jgi:hypothetical protein